MGGWLAGLGSVWMGGSREAGAEVGQVEAEMSSDKCKSSSGSDGAGMTFRCHGLVGGN